MNAASVALAFFDPTNRLAGIVRGETTLLFEGAHTSTPAGRAQLSSSGGGHQAVVHGMLELDFAPVAAPLQLDGTRSAICTVTGSVAGRAVDCLGTATDTTEPPRWAELDAVRVLSAVWDAETALLAVVQRPRDAVGHDEERSHAWLVRDGVPAAVEETRLSTVYDASGRQRSAGLELWLVDEDLPRRASGVAVAGTSLELEGLVVNAAVFDWTMDGREGQGLYELTTRRVPAVAA